MRNDLAGNNTLIISINGTRPTSIEQVHELLKGEDKKSYNIQRMVKTGHKNA